MAMSSQERRSFVKTYDQFSDLPDAIIYHIFSFLGANDILRLSILSRRFRQLCISSPYLSFKGIYDHESRQCPKKCKRFCSYLYNFLRMRDRAKVHRFDLSWTCNEGTKKEAILNTWIHDAVRCQVEELHLGIELKLMESKPYVLPHCIFDCPSLRDLELRLSNNSDYLGLNTSRTYLKLPSKDFSSLEVLSLGCFRIMDDYLGDWISTHCKCLRKLSLYRVDGLKKLSITSSSLEDFTIGLCFSELECLAVSSEKLHTLSINTGCLDSSDKTILMNIFSQGLRTLNWKGKFVGRFSKNFTAIQIASIYDFYGNYIKDHAVDILVEILNSVTQARVLQLNIGLLELLFLKDRLPILFENVDQLVVEVQSLKDCQIPILASFVRGLPNLTTLNIKCKSMSFECQTNKELLLSKGSRFYREYGESQNQLFHHLKVVEIEIDQENQESGLVEYLLRYAKGLEKITVVNLSSFFGKLSTSGFHTTTSRSGVYCLQKKFGTA